MRLPSLLLLALLTMPIACAAAEPPGDMSSGDATLPLPAPRPRIGLVLSGGGARGLAHVGVLKVLEQMRVPIDAIAGTSMGAVVGGLYASGLTAAQIEAVVTSTEWQQAFRDRPPRADLSFRRKEEDQDFLVKFPLGLKSGNFLLPQGLFQGQKLTQLLRRLTLPVAGTGDFDHLPTRFRAVCTDLETGDAVVLEQGDLTTAMRASASAPGVFAPVEQGGRLLVDGGLADNLPVSVARAMGVDRLIVVDVGFPLQKRQRLASVATISNQMLAILIRRSSNVQRRSLAADDVLIDPELGDASSFDFGAIGRAISLGEDAARAGAARLAGLALSPELYAQYRSTRDAARVGVARVDYVRVAEGAQRYDHALQSSFAPLANGQPPDAAQLERRVTDLYGRGNLESLDYSFETTPLGNGLVLDGRRNSWGPNYVRFGLSLQDDFEGNSSYNAAARFVLSELTTRGAEWVWDLQVGETPRIASEFYIPLDDDAHWFVSPQTQFQVRNVPLIEDGQRLAEYRVRSLEYGVDFGRDFGRSGELRAGVRRETGHSRVRLGDPTLPASDFDVREYFGRYSYDHLDDVNFPRSGQSLSVEWRGERTGLGSDQPADLLSADWRIARSRGRNTAVFWASAGTNLNSNAATVRTLFPLGGFLNLSGLAPDSISGRSFAIARALYYRKVGRGGEGFLNVPAYIGFSYEVGNVWQERRDISFNSALQHGSVFLGLDTLLGPVYLGTGFGEQGRTAFYLFLGRTF